MNLKKLKIEIVLGFIFFSFLFIQGAQGAGIKIRVIVENASIRLKPNMEGEIIWENVPPGAVFEAEKKEGEWFEVKFRSKVGVLMAGYIHEMYVEEFKEEPKKEPVPQPAVKKPAKIAAPVQPPAKPLKKVIKKIDISFDFGLGLSSFLNDSSRYSRDWMSPVNYDLTLLSGVKDIGTIDHQVKNLYGFGFSLSYFFGGGLGAQVRFDYNFGKIPDRTESQFKMTWTWATTGKTYEGKNSWNTEGDLSVMPLSFNLIYKLNWGGRIVPYFSAGVSYLMARVKVNSTRGYGLSWVVERLPYIDQYIDYLAIPIKVDKSLNSLGFNIGGGLDIHFSPSIAWTMEAVYFIGKKFEESWDVSPGDYKGNFWPEVTATLNQSGADILEKEISPLEISPSFFKILGGIKILF